MKTHPLSKSEFNHLVYKKMKEGMSKDQAYKEVVRLTEEIAKNHELAKTDKISFKEGFIKLKGESQ
jgi:hypothetical protein